MAMSYVLYIGVLLVCATLALLADKYNNKKCIWVIVVILTAVSGLRAYSVGLDTHNYVKLFAVIEDGIFEQAYGLELPFKYFCYIFLKIFPNYSLLLTACALITNGCIIWRLWDFRKISSFCCMVSCYYMGFFFMTLNTMRQFCAIGVLLYATKYLMQHKRLRYLLGVLIASVFHQSAFLGVALLCVDLLRWRHLTRRQKWLMVGIVMALPLILLYVRYGLMRYEKYLVYSDGNIGVIVTAKVAFFLLSALFVFLIYGKRHHFPDWARFNSEDKYNIILSISCYFVGLCLIFLSYFIPMMNRLGWYFTVFEGVYMGLLIKTKNMFHKCVFVVCVITLVGHGFVTAMTGDAQGTMPYLFIWR